MSKTHTNPEFLNDKGQIAFPFDRKNEFEQYIRPLLEQAFDLLTQYGLPFTFVVTTGLESGDNKQSINYARAYVKGIASAGPLVICCAELAQIASKGGGGSMLGGMFLDEGRDKVYHDITGSHHSDKGNIEALFDTLFAPGKGFRDPAALAEDEEEATPFCKVGDSVTVREGRHDDPLDQRTTLFNGTITKVYRTVKVAGTNVPLARVDVQTDHEDFKDAGFWWVSPADVQPVA